MSTPSPRSISPILLYNDECGVCRRIAAAVARAAQPEVGQARSVVVRPIGDSPEAVRALSPALDIWDAYATLHLLMPDGSMKLDGEAVAEVLRRLASTRWFSGVFQVSIFRRRPFQALLNLAYAILAEIRPLLGCESCGKPSVWLKPLVWLTKRVRALFGPKPARSLTAHFAARPPPVVASHRGNPAS